VLAEPAPQRRLLRAAAGDRQAQAGIVLARGEEGVREEVRALLAGQPPGVENGEGGLVAVAARHAARRREALDVDPTIPAGDPPGRHPELV
jgi:hypothetical protein